MARAVIRRRKSSVGAGDLDVEIGIADLLADHLQHTHGAENRISCDKRDLAAGSQSGRHSCAALLGNAAVDILPGQLVRERQCQAGFSDISVHDPDIRVLSSDLDDLVAVKGDRSPAF